LLEKLAEDPPLLELLELPPQAVSQLAIDRLPAENSKLRKKIRRDQPLRSTSFNNEFTCIPLIY
jgi:hypothetical protein